MLWCSGEYALLFSIVGWGELVIITEGEEVWEWGYGIELGSR